MTQTGLLQSMTKNTAMNISNATGLYEEQHQIFAPVTSAFINAIYIIITVVGIVSNCLSCLIFYKEKTLRKPFNIILLNLSIADMLACFTIQPFVWIDFSIIKQNKTMSHFLCGISFGLLFFMNCCLANIITLCTVTVHRYLVIVRDYRGCFVTSKNLTIAFCVFTWIAASAMNIPQAISHRYNFNESLCYMKWPTNINVSLFSLSVAVIFMAIPLFLMAVCYISLAVQIWKRSAIAPAANIAATRARKSVTMLVGLLMLALIVCWSPFCAVWILGRALNYFGDGLEGELDRQRWLRIAMIFAVFNSVLDPFIYAYSATEYRRGLNNLCFCFSKIRNKVANDTMSAPPQTQ